LSFPSLASLVSFPSRLVLLSSLLIISLASHHHRSVLMTHLYSLSNCQRYTPICQLTPAFANFALIFSVRRFYDISAAAMDFRSACPTLGQRTAGGPLLDQVSSHYTFAIQLAITFPSNYLESTASACHEHMNFMTFVPAAGWWQETPLSSLTMGLDVIGRDDRDEGEHQCTSGPYGHDRWWLRHDRRC